MTSPVTSPCVETTNTSRHPTGHGKCKVKRFGQIVWGTHRLAWIDAHGRLPRPNMQINHHCDNPPCVKVEHLYEGTPAENTADMVRRGRASDGTVAASIQRAKTECPSGHRYDESNTYVDPNGHRRCRVCSRDSVIRSRNKRHRPVASRTMCRRGHPFNEANTRITSRGHRECRVCTQAAYRARQVAS